MLIFLVVISLTVFFVYPEFIRADESKEKIIYVYPSADVSDNGKTLTIHKPDKYYDKDIEDWVFSNITDVLKMSFDKTTGIIKYSYKNDKYYVIARLFLVVNVTENVCRNKGWIWNDGNCILFWDDTKQFIQDNNIDYDLDIEKKEPKWKYSINLTGISQEQADKILYVGLYLENSHGLNWDDVKIRDGSLIIKDKFKLGFRDLKESGHTVHLYDKRTVLIGNVVGQTSLYLDPDLTIDGGITTLCGYNDTFDKIEVINSGTLKICDYDGSPTNCEGGGVASGCGYVNISCSNFTVEYGSMVSGAGVGGRGGDGCSAEDCTASDGENNGKGGGATNDGSSTDGGGGAGFGGVGGLGGSDGGGVRGSAGSTYSTSTSSSLNHGSGGGGCTVYFSFNGAGATGGNGGGGFKVNVGNGEINIYGTIDVDGEVGATGIRSTDYHCGSGGGSGGEIIIYGKTIDVTSGTLTAKAGSGGDAGGAISSGAGGGGGGGGRIKIFYSSISGNDSATYTVTKGTAGTSKNEDNAAVDGDIGTLYFESVSFDTGPPTYSLNQTNTTVAGKPTLFSLNWTDDQTLDSYIFSFYNGSDYQPEVCSGTADACDIHGTQTDCELCGCDWSVGAGGYKIQQGTYTMTGTDEYVALSYAVSDIDRAFVLRPHYYSCSPDTDAVADDNALDPDECLTTVYLYNTTHIRMERHDGAGEDIYVDWQVIECLGKEFNVSRGTKTWSDADGTSFNISIGTTVNETNTMALVWTTGDSTSLESFDTTLFRAYAVNTTHIQIDRDVADAGIGGTLKWVAVEFNHTKIDNFQTGTSSVSGADDEQGTPQQETITAINISQSILVHQIGVGDSGLDQVSVAGRIKDSTTIEFYKHVSENTRNIRWYVIDFGSGVGNKQSGTEDYSADTTQSQFDKTLTAVQLNRTIFFISSTNDGTGTAFPRPFWMGNLTSITNLRHFRSRSGQEHWNEWQVLELPTGGCSGTEDVCGLGTCNTTCGCTHTPLQEFLNDTAVAFGAGTWSNVTKTVNSTTGATKLEWKFLCKPIQLFNNVRSRTN